MKYFYFVAAAVMLLSGLAVFDEMSAFGAAMLAVGGFCVFKGVTAVDSKSRGRRELELKEMAAERAELLQENYAKAIADFNTIEAARRSVGDVDLSRSLAQMQQVGSKLLRYLEKNPEKLPTAAKFIDYYQDRAAHLATKYAELEETGINTADVEDLKRRVKTALSEMNNAYAEQFAVVLNDRIIDMDAELKVLQQTMIEDGVGKRQISLGKPGEAVGVLPSANAPRRLSGRELSIIPPAKRSDVVLTKVLQSALAVFLGGFGAHKFYQGKTMQGVFYVLFCWTGIPSLIGFCEGLKYLFMKLDDFYLDYYERR